MLEINDNVCFIGDNKIIEGRITGLYEELKLAIVRLDSGEKVKIPYEKLAKVKEAEAPKFQEKEQITLTPTEFRNIACSIIKKEAESSPIITMAFTIFITKLHKALFLDGGEND